MGVGEPGDLHQAALQRRSDRGRWRGHRATMGRSVCPCDRSPPGMPRGEESATMRCRALERAKGALMLRDRALLVGSVNLPSPEDVFRAVATYAGDVVSRIPDGETDARHDWIVAQVPGLDR